MTDLNTVARIMNIKKERLETLSEEAQRNMISCVEMLGDNLENSENFKEVYSELQKIWSVAINDKELEEVSVGTGIPRRTLLSLPIEVKQEINFEYGFTNGNIDRIYDIINKYHREHGIAEVASFLNIPIEKLSELSVEEQSQIYGAFEMDEAVGLDEAERRADLIDHLKNYNVEV